MISEMFLPHVVPVMSITSLILAESSLLISYALAGAEAWTTAIETYIPDVRCVLYPPSLIVGVYCGHVVSPLFTGSSPSLMRQESPSLSIHAPIVRLPDLHYVAHLFLPRILSHVFMLHVLVKLSTMLTLFSLASSQAWADILHLRYAFACSYTQHT